MSQNSEEIKKQAEAQKEVNQEARNFTQEAQEGLRFTRDINTEIRNRLQILKGEKDLRNSTLKALKEANNLAEDQIDLAKAGAKALMDEDALRKKQLKFQQNIAKLQANADDLELKRKFALNNLINNRSKMSQDEIKAEQQKIKDANAAQKGIRDQITNQEASLEVLDKQVDAASELNSLGSNRLFGSLSEIAGTVPGLGKLTKGFDKAAEASKKIGAQVLQKQLEEGGKSSLSIGKGLSVGFKGAIAGANELMKALGPIAILTKVVQGMFKADKSAGAIAKGLNQSYDAAQQTSKELLKVADSADSTLVTYDAVKEATLDINKALGTSVSIGKKQLQEFVEISKASGLTNEQMMGINSLSLTTNKSLKTVTKEFLAQAKITSRQNGVILNEKELLADIGNISAATTLSLGKNPGLLAQAVATAKSLGIEFGKLDSIAESLLQFESSIESELEAELLLGKNLNLEKARTAALNNDMTVLAEEIAKQAGSAAEFTKMNRLEQEALAQAVGMNREDLAQTLFTQEQLAGLTGEQAEEEKRLLNAAIEKNGLAAVQKAEQEGTLDTLLNQASKQEELAASAERINQIFMEMGKSLTPILEASAAIVEFTAKNIELLLTAAGIYQGINTYLLAQKLLKAAGNKEAIKELLTGKSRLAQLAAQAVAYALANPFRALAGVAIAATVGAVAYNAMSKADDMVSLPSAGGKGGYGSRILTGPQGSVALNNKDTVVAGTNLNPGGSSNNVSVDMSETNTLLRQILSKQGTVSLDAEKMGTAISMNTYEISP